jgi:hypothetical protein
MPTAPAECPLLEVKQTSSSCREKLTEGRWQDFAAVVTGCTPWAMGPAWPAQWTPRLVQQRLREAFAVEQRLHDADRPREMAHGRYDMRT